MKCAATKLQENHFDYSVVVLRFVTVCQMEVFVKSDYWGYDF